MRAMPESPEHVSSELISELLGLGSARFKYPKSGISWIGEIGESCSGLRAFESVGKRSFWVV